MLSSVFLIFKTCIYIFFLQVNTLSTNPEHQVTARRSETQLRELYRDEVERVLKDYWLYIGCISSQAHKL
jgi:hypothetical protein